MCTVWREGSQEADSEVEIFGEEGRLAVPDLHDLTNLPRRKVHRQRLVLSLALLAQVMSTTTRNIYQCLILI